MIVFHCLSNYIGMFKENDVLLIDPTDSLTIVRDGIEVNSIHLSHSEMSDLLRLVTTHKSKFAQIEKKEFSFEEVVEFVAAFMIVEDPIFEYDGENKQPIADFITAYKTQKESYKQYTFAKLLHEQEPPIPALDFVEEVK